MREIRSWRVALAMGVMLVSGGCASDALAPRTASAPCAVDVGAELAAKARESGGGPFRIRICNVAGQSARQPLILVDGSEIPQSELPAIVPERIESVEILKGPSGVAVYGERAANGVILIRTKRS
jgi:TonB-dependent starch-binding outer membrane protein SusC